MKVTKAGRKAAIKARFGLTSRQTNSVLNEADGKRAAIIALYKDQLIDLRSKIKRTTAGLKRDAGKLAAER